MRRNVYHSHRQPRAIIVIYVIESVYVFVDASESIRLTPDLGVTSTVVPSSLTAEQ
jgi:hypothetical protein